MKKLVAVVGLLSVCAGVFAQVKGKTVYYGNADWENDQVKIFIVDAVAQAGYSKYKIRFQSKTKDFIAYYPSETTFTFSFGETKTTRDKMQFAKPYEFATRVVETAGGYDYRQEAYSLALNGVYRVSSEGKVHQAPDFKLPHSTVQFNAGPFSVSLLDRVQKTDVTAAKFKVIYNGDKIGIVDPVKAVCRIPNGQEFAVFNVGVKPNILEQGGEDRFTLDYRIPARVIDMQFAELFIVWKDCFRESEKEPIKVPNFEMKMTSSK
ncbi:MAG: hypothetical protein MH137_11035 [Flavobacteriales bacterium]|nr:hypothetical protein [Flavobacteriales bacterium]